MPVAERQSTYVASFEALRSAPEAGPDWLREAREAAFARFVARGFPTTRDEDWRYTNVAPIAQMPFERAPAATLSRAAIEPFLFDGGGVEIVVVNGRIVSALSTAGAPPAGLTVRSLREYQRAGATWPSSRVSGTGQTAGASPFVDLNAAFVEDGVVIEVAPKAIVTEPVHVLFVSMGGSAPVMISPRLIVVAGEHAQVSIVESYAGTGHGTTFANAVTDLLVGPGAVVSHIKLQRELAAAFHIANMSIRVDRAGTVTSHSISFGARIARNDVLAVLDGEGAECTLNGLYVANGESLVDNHTTIDHAKAHCPSHELYKGILDGRARAVFNGKIIVRPDAQKTDAKQTNKALLLTDDAQINTKPQLEIFADDVKCTHGAAIGQLDEDALFYLRARGVALGDARNLLIHAFAGDVLQRVKVDAVREKAMRLLEEKLRLPAA